MNYSAFRRLCFLLLIGLLIAACDGSDRRADGAATALPPPSLPEAAFPLSTGGQLPGATDIATCAGCHATQVDEWSASHHAHANRPVSPELDGPAFTPAREVREAGVTYRMERRGDEFLVSVVADDGTAIEYPLVGVIGHTPIRQYLAQLTGNRFQALSALYHVEEDRWLDVFEGEHRQPGEWGHWTGQGMNWNANCAWCHTTDYRKQFDFAANRYDSSWVQQGVTCASCHGDLERHIVTASSGGDLALPARLPAAVMMETCVGCHSRRDQLTADGFKAGDHYHDHFALSLPDQPGLYHADGQILDEVFVYGSFAMSKMHGAGVTCQNCHNPHSLKTLLSVEDNSLCQSCHLGGALGAPVIDPVAHSVHPAGSSGNQCVNCHMPKTTYMQADPRADHGFLLPDPMMTKELGIPNACSNCHLDKDLDWAVTAAEQRHGRQLADSRQRRRALALHAAYGDNPEALAGLLALLDDEANPAWRATYVGLIANYLPEQRAAAAIAQASRDDHPLVRARAATALGQQAFDQQALDQQALNQQGSGLAAAMDLLADDSRAVRIAAGLGLSAGGQHIADDRVRNELDQYLQFHRDRPQSLLLLAGNAARDGRRSEVLDNVRRAVRLDSRNAGLYHQGAILLSGAGLNSEARKTLLDGWSLFPDNAVLPYSLGLLAGEAGDLETAIRYLKKTVELDPAFTRAWYNLSLAYTRTGQAAEAQQAMERASGGDR